MLRPIPMRSIRRMWNLRWFTSLITMIGVRAGFSRHPGGGGGQWDVLQGSISVHSPHSSFLIIMITFMMAIIIMIMDPGMVIMDRGMGTSAITTRLPTMVIPLTRSGMGKTEKGVSLECLQ